MEIDSSRVPTIKKFSVGLVAFAIVLVAIVFQIGHFAEHIAQVAVWIFGERMAPYMTPAGMWLMEVLGKFFAQGESMERQMGTGLETLHLIGNLIYVVGTLGLWYFVRCRALIWANVLQIFHVLEHISLTLSYYYINQAIGMSTLYGMPIDHMTSVTIRVWWHFLANAIPTLLVLYVLYSIYNKRP